jgi:hypothetical protein
MSEVAAQPGVQDKRTFPLITPRALSGRTRLTVSNGPGKPIFRPGINDTERTWLTILPLESHCFAVRLGFANPFAESMPIMAASIVPSDSYHPVTGATGPGTSGGVATGDAPRVRVSFDSGGLDGSRIVASGQSKGLIISGDPHNPNNETKAFTIFWSDWVPVRSIPRRDGGSNPLLFIYVALQQGSMSTAGFSYPFTFSASKGSRNRSVVSLRSDLGGDWTDNASGTCWSGATPAPSGNGSQWGLSPLFCLQYLSIVPGIQGVISGDSLMCGPGGEQGDGFSSAPIRAAYDLSALSRPICVAHMACGGTGSEVYNAALLRNIEALRPSFLVLQPLSRNDGMVQAMLDLLLAKLLATSDLAEAEYGARTIYQGAYPIPSVDPANGGSHAQIAAWNNIRGLLNTMAEAGTPVYDGASLIGDASAPWLYGRGLSDDGTHPNDLATEMLTPKVRRLIELMLVPPCPEG